MIEAKENSANDLATKSGASNGAVEGFKPVRPPFKFGFNQWIAFGVKDVFAVCFHGQFFVR